MKLQLILELIGTYFFAISGALALKDKDQDWFAALFTGFLTAIGGGTIRDMLLDSYPLVWIADISLIYAILAGVITTFVFYRMLSRLRRTLLLFDTLGIAFFTIVGVEKALSLGVRAEIAAIMGVFTAVMGGVIRDTLSNELPVIFRREIYASACFFGTIVYLSLDSVLPRDINLILAVIIIVMTRILAMKFRWTLPAFGGSHRK